MLPIFCYLISYRRYEVMKVIFSTPPGHQTVAHIALCSVTIANSDKQIT